MNKASQKLIRYNTEMGSDIKLSELKVLKTTIAKKLSLLMDYLDKLHALVSIVAIEGGLKYSIEQLISDSEALDKDLPCLILLHTS